MIDPQPMPSVSCSPSLTEPPLSQLRMLRLREGAGVAQVSQPQGSGSGFAPRSRLHAPGRKETSGQGPTRTSPTPWSVVYSEKKAGKSEQVLHTTGLWDNWWPAGCGPNVLPPYPLLTKHLAGKRSWGQGPNIFLISLEVAGTDPKPREPQAVNR